MAEFTLINKKNSDHILKCKFQFAENIFWTNFEIISGSACVFSFGSLI